MYLLLKLLHVLAAFGLVTGLVGRALTFRGAARAGTIDPAAALLGASHWFDERLVIPSAGRITPELRTALDDRSARTARAVEALLIASIVVLMVLKP